MKVRIGYGLGTQGMQDEGERFGAFVDALERLRFDSLWLSERITGDAPDPIVGCAFAAGRTTKLKFGFSVLVLPGRNPVVLAKELATLDRLSGGRLLPAFGLGVADPAEQQGFGLRLRHAGKLRAITIHQLEAPAAAAVGIDRDSGRTQLVYVAVDGAHRDFELTREFACTHASARLQQHQNREQTAGQHFFSLSEIHDARCHV